MAGQLSGGIRSVWAGAGRVYEPSSPCKASCCKTPYGHSAAARNCRCHDVPDDPGAVSVYGVEISEEEFNNRCGEKP